jgi:ABC-type nitrate/sulfonate/bicarbonate transport system ATPase subunit
MTTLTLQDISLSFGETPVLDGVSLHIEPGEFVSILGPSGCGKSSLFRLLTGALRPDSGRITLAAKPLEQGSRTFAFMPQRDALLPWARILDNMTLGLEVQGMTREAARAKVKPLLPAFGLAGFENHYPAQLSGGMRQRAAFLRTIVQERPIQLLDEPFGALDALTRMSMQRWLEERREQNQDRSWTTLLVTHDVREAVALSDRIYVLSRRPARVIEHLPVPMPRPRFGTNATTRQSAQLEAELLQTLLTQTGDIS